MPVETITYETPEFLQQLIAHDVNLLRRLGETFGIKITSRDEWVRFDGAEAEVSLAKEVLTQLERVGRQGGPVTESLFTMVTESVKEARGDQSSSVSQCSSEGDASRSLAWRRAACSHSASVGSRASRKRAKASASK